MPQQQRCLSNGLRVVLNEDPQATRAAALLQVDVGSHHEPDAWPGLAHLLEHLLFAGSQGFPDDQRLMAWLPAQGGRLNATTLGSSTAYFFECAPEQLAAALARLTDMLLAPLLSEQAIRQEVATIDAECRLLASHQDTLCDAALSAAFFPHPWQRFQTGNAAAFGGDTVALRAALQQFHQHHYHAGTLTLWLQGPQSVASLWQLAQQMGAAFPARGALAPPLPALTLQTRCDRAVQLSGAPRLRLSFLFSQRIDDGLALLRQLLLDEAPGSLMAALREQALCDDIRLLLPYRNARQTVVAIELVLVSAHLADQAEARVHHWLRQLLLLTPAQRVHYARLADQQFSRLAVMDQLRESAFGFAPAAEGGDESGAVQLFAQLVEAPFARLWVTGEPLTERLYVQGVSLSCQLQMREAIQPDASGSKLFFYPQPLAAVLPVLPIRQVPLAHCRQDREAVLLLCPEGDLPASWGHILQERLRALAADCVHQGGDLAVTCQQGRWLIQLRGRAELMVGTLGQLNTLLREIPPAVIACGEREYLRQRDALREDIAIRALLAALPELLISSFSSRDGQPSRPRPWRAQLEGGDIKLHQQLACLLSDFPGEVNPAVRSRPETLPPQGEYRVPTASRDAALLRFCPLVEESAVGLAAWQLLAMIFQPLFFQRLRVEQNIGYVVSCRFYQAAGRSGILFALQSPHLTHAELSQCIDRFLQQMDAVLIDLSSEVLWEKCLALLAEQQQQQPGVLEASRHRWQLAQQGFPPPDITDLRMLTPERLRVYHQRLLAHGKQTWQVVNRPLV